jgi:hypothetical protein
VRRNIIERVAWTTPFLFAVSRVAKPPERRSLGPVAGGSIPRELAHPDRGCIVQGHPFVPGDDGSGEAVVVGPDNFRGLVNGFHTYDRGNRTKCLVPDYLRTRADPVKNSR